MFRGDCDYKIKDDVIEVTSIAGADYFVDPFTSVVKTGCAFVYEELEGDFILTARVSLEKSNIYDGAALMCIQDDRHWIKACLEQGNWGFASECTVVTNTYSDDANGVTVDKNEIWLRLARTGDTFSVHYSYDGKEFFMARLARVPMNSKLKVGFEAQSPNGKANTCYFRDYSLVYHGFEDPRMAN